jgi:hypothetical protein
MVSMESKGYAIIFFGVKFGGGASMHHHCHIPKYHMYVGIISSLVKGVWLSYLT